MASSTEAQRVSIWAISLRLAVDACLSLRGRLLAAALTFGGVDLRKVARIRQELERVANQAGLPPDAIADVAARIAILEVQDPQVARALRALAPPRTRRPTTNPARRPRRSTLGPDDGDEGT